MESNVISRAPVNTSYYFGACPKCGQCEDGMNVGRSHWLVCHTHKTRWWVGENLFSEWRDENQEIWDANAQKLADYLNVEPLPMVYEEGTGT